MRNHEPNHERRAQHPDGKKGGGQNCRVVGPNPGVVKDGPEVPRLCFGQRQGNIQKVLKNQGSTYAQTRNGRWEGTESQQQRGLHKLGPEVAWAQSVREAHAAQRSSAQLTA